MEFWACGWFAGPDCAFPQLLLESLNRSKLGHFENFLSIDAAFPSPEQILAAAINDLCRRGEAPIQAAQELRGTLHLARCFHQGRRDAVGECRATRGRREIHQVFQNPGSGKEPVCFRTTAVPSRETENLGIRL